MEQMPRFASNDPDYRIICWYIVLVTNHNLISLNGSIPIYGGIAETNLDPMTYLFPPSSWCAEERNIDKLDAASIC